MNQTTNAPDGGLFQSELWKEFQKSLCTEIFETEYFWGTLDRAPLLGNYGEISRGPIKKDSDSEKVVMELCHVAREKKLSCIRIEPQEESFLNALSQSMFTIKKAPLDVQPREILMMPLEDSPEHLLAQMKPKTRYNIRLAEKKGITVRAIATDEEREQFLQLFAMTAKRKSISFHDQEYYRAFMEFFTEQKGQTFVAVKDGRVLCGGMVVLFEETAYYVHGASSDEGRNLMAPHLLQWEQIQYARNNGCTQYDFGGVSQNIQLKGKDWGGITRFKKGFAPNTPPLLFPGTYDIIFSPVRYFSYKLLARFKKIFL